MGGSFITIFHVIPMGPGKNSLVWCLTCIPSSLANTWNCLECLQHKALQIRFTEFAILACYI